MEYESCVIGVLNELADITCQLLFGTLLGASTIYFSYQKQKNKKTQLTFSNKKLELKILVASDPHESGENIAQLGQHFQKRKNEIDFVLAPGSLLNNLQGNFVFCKTV